jgi:predicted GTPase
MERESVIIMGAAGRDFHNFNTFFRNNETYNVIGFTATQIPNIEGRRYPPELAGTLYPDGIPIYPEKKLAALIKEQSITTAVFSYSDVSHSYVMHKASEVIAAGANFLLLGARDTMIPSKKPVISICAVRTGCGKSQSTRRIADILQKQGKKVVVIRHPMPYGNLKEQIVQRFATYKDLKKHHCTIEEREEYEPHLEKSIVVYAGVDYEKILREAENEADVVLWDGGNNDIPFYVSDVHFVVVDPHRPGHELLYHPGEANLRMADAIIINKMDSAKPEDIVTVRNNAKRINPQATIVEADSPVTIDDPSIVKGKKVLIIEDGPTLTHGGMAFGAGYVAAQKIGVKEIIDPRPYAVRTIAGTFTKFPQLEKILPAMGYGKAQVDDLAETINATPADAVLIATPIDLGKLIDIKKPHVRVKYKLLEREQGILESIIQKHIES